MNSFTSWFVGAPNALYKSVTISTGARSFGHTPTFTYQKMIDWHDLYVFCEARPFLVPGTDSYYLLSALQELARLPAGQAIRDCDYIEVRGGSWPIFLLLNRPETEQQTEQAERQNIVIHLPLFIEACQRNKLFNTMAASCLALTLCVAWRLR